MHAPRVIGAIDVGSNSIRIAVVRVDGDGTLEVIEEARDVPQLVREVQATGRLGGATIDRVTEVLGQFQTIAQSAGADDVVVVATSAVREAENGGDLSRRVRRRTGLELRVIDGMTEARLAFLGAVHGLPATDGIVVDIGGGSVELARFADRKPTDTWTLPLGALRLTDRFLKGNPPTPQQVRDLRKHAANVIDRVGDARLPEGGQLIGTGGTVRNLAKVDRARSVYPIPSLHGYMLTAPRLQALGDLLQSRKAASRASIRGLNPDRVDTIVAGAMIAQVLLEALKAESMTVSGQGLREGVALAECSEALPALASVRAASIRQLVQRFAAPRAANGQRRMQVISAILETNIAVLSPEVRDALSAAAGLLDIGRSVDFYNRHRHAVALLLGHGLPGFTHREQALMAAIVLRAEHERADVADYAPLLGREDEHDVGGAAAVLALADDLANHLPDGSEVSCEIHGEELLFKGVPGGWKGEALAGRYLRAFGLTPRAEEAPQPA